MTAFSLADRQVTKFFTDGGREDVWVFLRPGASQETEQKAIEMGAVRTLSKPVQGTELVEIIDDPELYTGPWRAEFSLTRHDGPIYEYACHEGNYSTPTILIGGQAQAAKRAETEPLRD